MAVPWARGPVEPKNLVQFQDALPQKESYKQACRYYASIYGGESGFRPSFCVSYYVLGQNISQIKVQHQTTIFHKDSR